MRLAAVERAVEENTGTLEAAIRKIQDEEAARAKPLSTQPFTVETAKAQNPGLTDLRQDHKALRKQLPASVAGRSMLDIAPPPDLAGARSSPAPTQTPLPASPVPKARTVRESAGPAQISTRSTRWLKLAGLALILAIAAAIVTAIVLQEPAVPRSTLQSQPTRPRQGTPPNNPLWR